MSIYQVLDKFLTKGMRKLIALSAMASLVLMQGCETDAVGVDVYSSQSADVLTCVFESDADIAVHVTRSVPYTSSSMYASVEEAYVTLSIAGRGAITQRIDSSRTITTFAAQHLSAGDSVTISAHITDDGKKLKATAVVMPKVEIESIDTLNTASDIIFTLAMTDDPATSDIYQIETHRIDYHGGVAAADSTISCTYISSAFSDLLSSTYGSRPIGLFSDERLTTNSLGQSELRFSVSKQTLMRPTLEGEADSSEVAIRLYHHSEDYYDFLSSSNRTQSYILLPVFGTSTTSSNVEGGYGIVACLVYDEWRIRPDFMINSGDDYNSKGSTDEGESGDETEDNVTGPTIRL